METQHTYRISHRGIESTPFSITDLRQMWQAGQIDATTKFKRGNSTVWLDASDLMSELKYLPPAKQRDTEELTTKASHLSSSSLAGPLRTSSSVKVTSLRVPFRDVLVLTLKFYAAAMIIAAGAAVLGIILLRLFPK
jgi:hypothetical protein